MDTNPVANLSNDEKLYVNALIEHFSDTLENVLGIKLDIVHVVHVQHEKGEPCKDVFALTNMQSMEEAVKVVRLAAIMAPSGRMILDEPTEGKEATHAGPGTKQ